MPSINELFKQVRGELTKKAFAPGPGMAPPGPAGPPPGGPMPPPGPPPAGPMPPGPPGAPPVGPPGPMPPPGGEMAPPPAGPGGDPVQMLENVVQRSVQRAIQESGLDKKVNRLSRAVNVIANALGVALPEEDRATKEEPPSPGPEQTPGELGGAPGGEEGPGPAAPPELSGALGGMPETGPPKQAHDVYGHRDADEFIDEFGRLIEQMLD